MESMARHYNGLKTTLVIEIVSENCLDIIRRVTRNFSGNVSRNVLSKQCRNQLYFSFIHNYINHTNIVRENTKKSKFERLYPYQKHTACVIYHKDLYTHASPLTNDTKALKCFPIKYV